MKQSTASYASQAFEKYQSRWEYSHCAFFAAAYACDPEFIDHDLNAEAEVQEGLRTTVEKIGILLKVRALAAASAISQFQRV